jgi:hypothetical protein
MRNSGGTTMRITYFSIDEVNRLLVRRWAAGQGARVVCPSVQSIVEPLEGVVLDFDFLPEPYRSNWLHLALTGEIPGPVLVHGHGLTDSEARGLARRGVTVCRGRLRRRVLRQWVEYLTAAEASAA